MTTIRVSCPQCGAVDLAPTDVQLTVVRGEDTPVGPESHYSFHCPTCADDIAKPADERIARLLTTGGVHMEVRGAPSPYHPSAQRTGHPESPSPGPAFTVDDLLDFHLALQCDDWFERLALGAGDR